MTINVKVNFENEQKKKKLVTLKKSVHCLRNCGLNRLFLGGILCYMHQILADVYLSYSFAPLSFQVSRACSTVCLLEN